MPTCLFCLNKNIIKIFGDGTSIANDMLLFFGHQIEGYLRADDIICNVCLNIMENVARLKEALLPYIFREDQNINDKKPSLLGNKWQYFASFTKEDNPWISASSTPNGLISCKKIVPYQRSPIEERVVEYEPPRSLSRISGYSIPRSEVDSEVSSITKRKRRRRRGHNWTKRKISRYSSLSESRPTSSRSRATSRATYRAFSPDSDVSYTTEYSIRSNNNKRSKKLDYMNGYTVNERATTPTREHDVLIVNIELYQCQECKLVYEDLDLFAIHKQNVHGHLALHWCHCGKRYTTKEELQQHAANHIQIHVCVICKREFNTEGDLLKHWQEHVRKSVICEYCKKRYMNKDVLIKHKARLHEEKTVNRIVLKDRQEDDEKKSNNFEVRVLIQDNVSREDLEEEEEQDTEELVIEQNDEVESELQQSSPLEVFPENEQILENNILDNSITDS